AGRDRAPGIVRSGHCSCGSAFARRVGCPIENSDRSASGVTHRLSGPAVVGPDKRTAQGSWRSSIPSRCPTRSTIRFTDSTDNAPINPPGIVDPWALAALAPALTPVGPTATVGDADVCVIWMTGESLAKWMLLPLYWVIHGPVHCSA